MQKPEVDQQLPGAAGGVESDCSWVRVSFREDRNILKLGCGDVAQLCRCTKIIDLYDLNG